MAKADWIKIKSEYIRTGISYRDLAKKHGVSLSTLCHRASKEKWADLRQQKGNIVNTRIIESAAEREIERQDLIQSVADMLLKTIAREIASGMIEDPQHIKQLSSALKDLKDVKGIKSDIDLEEQKARIVKLKADSRTPDDDSTSSYGVVILPAIAEEPGDEVVNDDE